MRNLEGVRGLSKKVEWVTGCLTSMIGMQKNRQIIRINLEFIVFYLCQEGSHIKSKPYNLIFLK